MTVFYHYYLQGNIHKAKTAYNERVVASTPVLTAEQRRHLQELQDREHALKHQIQLLQKEYENLEVRGNMKKRIALDVHVPFNYT